MPNRWLSGRISRSRLRVVRENRVSEIRLGREVSFTLDACPDTLAVRPFPLEGGRAMEEIEELTVFITRADDGAYLAQVPLIPDVSMRRNSPDEAFEKMKQRAHMWI